MFSVGQQAAEMAVVVVSFKVASILITFEEPGVASYCSSVK